MIFKKKNRIEKINPKTDNFKEPKPYHEEKKIYSIALVLDNEVQDILRTEERLWAMLMSNPVIVDITDNETRPQLNWEYNEETGEFTNPNAIQPNNEEDQSSI
jgi:hypothetical protein